VEDCVEVGEAEGLAEELGDRLVIEEEEGSIDEEVDSDTVLVWVCELESTPVMEGHDEEDMEGGKVSVTEPEIHPDGVMDELDVRDIEGLGVLVEPPVSVTVLLPEGLTVAKRVADEYPDWLPDPLPDPLPIAVLDGHCERVKEELPLRLSV